ncbi:MAG: mannose-6-phosphate isomerase [bacterium]|nr:mannose-6-phosphate isomerase [bacterium]
MIPDIICLSLNRVWRTYLGGKVLDLIEDKDEPDDSHFPEVWIGSTVRAVNKGRENIIEGFSSVTIDGKQTLLRDLISRFPEEMVGGNHYTQYGPHTQVLVKFLDAAIRLHLQCHPTIAFARKYLGSPSGKTEAYVILQIREEVTEPYIYLGFQNPPQRAAFKQAIQQQDIAQILSCFEKIRVQPGDVFIVPGGLPHAIGEGIFTLEIMEPTDLAARIEFERGGYVLPETARFMGRDIDLALSMFHFERISRDEVKNTYFSEPRLIRSFEDGSCEYSLIREEQTSCFRVNKLEVRGNMEKEDESFYIGIVIKGHGAAFSGDRRYTLRTWDRFFIPQKTQRLTFSSDDDMDIITIYPP